jgi:hypothetical protein
MQRHTYITLPCQYCQKPELRVSWRKGNAVTCFSCKTGRRSELAKRKAQSSPALQTKTSGFG